MTFIGPLCYCKEENTTNLNFTFLPTLNSCLCDYTWESVFGYDYNCDVYSIFDNRFCQTSRYGLYHLTGSPFKPWSGRRSPWEEGILTFQGTVTGNVMESSLYSICRELKHDWCSLGHKLCPSLSSIFVCLWPNLDLGTAPKFLDLGNYLKSRKAKPFNKKSW